MDLAICQDPKQVIGPEQYFDIRDILKDNSINNLTDNQKYMLYRNHFVQDNSYSFHKSFQHGCNRSCKPNHLSSSFVYSKNDDAVFCLYCSLFCNCDTRSQLSSFVNQGYSEWHNILEKQQRRVGNEYHSTAMTEAFGIIGKFKTVVNTIDYQTSQDIQNRYSTYPQIIEALARIVYLLGRQGLAFRGHRENLEEDESNMGNFLAIVKEIANSNPILKEHIEKPIRKDVTYVRPKSQNELIELIGRNFIQCKLLEDIKNSKIHAISADEVTSSNDEIMSIYFRYVDENLNIREVFIEFVVLERITGEHIGNRLLKFYVENGLDIREFGGQCYDGAANMQSQKKGPASFILKESLRAVITHCCSHNLNLSLSSSCKEPIIHNILETYKSIIIFFNTSPKREGLLEYIYSVRCQPTETRKILAGLCGTPWSEDDISYERFYLAILFIAEAFEVINGTHPELQTLHKERTTGWDAHVKREATSFLNALTKFEFIVGIIILYRLLHPVPGLINFRDVT